jgi:multiple sugar transport system permease protein
MAIGEPSVVEASLQRGWRGWLNRMSGMDRDRLEQAIVGYAFVLPDLIGLLVFIVGPMVMALVISLTDWKLVGEPQFIGLRNYATIFKDPKFGASLGRTIIYTISFVPVVYTLSLGMAVLLTRRSRSNFFFRTIYFMPVAMSLVVAGVIWRFMFEPGTGLINEILGAVGLPTSQWTGSVQTAMLSVIIVSVWKSAGYFMIILLAGIQDIPSDYIEAAQIDGANRNQVFWGIILPLLKPTSFFVLVILTINALQAFDQIYVMTRGGPAQATYTLLMYTYEKAFREWNFGYAAAMSVALFAMIFVLTLIQVRYFRTGEVRD